MLQDDSYIESYISTIGVDFVSTTLQIIIWNCLKQCLNSPFHVNLCRKYVLLSRMERPLNYRSYVFDWPLCLFIYWYFVSSELDLTFLFSLLVKYFALSGSPKVMIVLTYSFLTLICDLFLYVVGHSRARTI